MDGRIALIALIASLGFQLTVAEAQETERRGLSLSERLQQFRQDLGGDRQNRNTKAAPPAKGGKLPLGSPPATVPAQPQAQPTPAATASSNPSSTPPATTPQSAPVTVHPKMQAQAARRAQPSPHFAPGPVEVAGLPNPPSEKMTPVRRPGSQQPTPAVADDSDAIEDEPTPASEEEFSTPPVRSRMQPRVARSLPREPIAEEPTPSEAGDEPVAEAAPAAEPTRAPRYGSAPEQAGSNVLFSSQSPVLSVKASGPSKVLIGREAEFVVKVDNAGAAANNVIISLQIPNYVEVVSTQPTAGTTHAPSSVERREPLEWKIDRLESNSSETLSLKLVPRKSTPLDLAVQWTFTPEASQTFVEVQEPKLAMSITGPDEVLYGQSKVYKLHVSNPGNGDTDNVNVSLLPIGRASEGAATHRLGTLRAGESKTIDIELTARQAGAITIKAQAFADGGLRADAAEQVLVRRASLRLEVEAPKVKYAGTVGTYRLKLINAGNATAENVQVAAMLPPEARYVSSSAGGRHEAQQGKVTWMAGTLQPGGQRVFEMQCALSAPGDNRVQFVTMADGDLSAAATSNTRVEALADLKLEVRDPQGPIPVGEDAVYEVNIRNRGTKAADGIDVAVFFSEGLEAISVEGGPHEIGPGQVIFKPIGVLSAGETATFRVRARAESSGNHIFRVEVICKSLNTKLATEETTHFYGDDVAARAEASRPVEPRPNEPRLAKPPQTPTLAVPPQQPTLASPEQGGLAPFEQPAEE